MNKLDFEAFSSPSELCEWVNKNNIDVVSIVDNDFYNFMVFYRKKDNK